MDLSLGIRRIWVCQIFKKKNNSLSWLSISILRKGSFAPTPISSNKLGFKYEVPWLCSQTKRLLDLFSVAFLSWHIDLIKCVLEANLVYWFSLSYIAVGILEKIKEKRFNFLWKKNKGKNSIPVLQWDRLAKPKLFGGLRLQNTH